MAAAAGAVLTLGGALAGGFLGGSVGAQIGALAGGLVAAALFPPGGPRVTDLTVSASTYGMVIPEVWGTMRLPGNMIWSTPLQEHSGGGAGGKGGMSGYNYTASFAMAICAGEIDDVVRVFADNKLIYGSPPAFIDPTDPNWEGNVINNVLTHDKHNGANMRIYKGTEDQLPDSAIEADKGAGNTPAYRGVAYLVFENMPLKDFGNRIPNISVEVSKNVKTSYPRLQFNKLDGEPTYWRSTLATFWDKGTMITPNGAIDHYDLSSMSQSLTAAKPVGLSEKNLVTPNYIYTELNAQNSRPIGCFNPFSGQLEHTIGRGGGSFGHWGDPCEFFGDEQYGALGCFGEVTAEGAVILVSAIPYANRVLLFNVPNGKYPKYDFEPDFFPQGFVAGQVGKKTSQIVGYANDGHKLRMMIISTGAKSWKYGADFPGGCPGSGQPYKVVIPASDTSVSYSEVSLGTNFSASLILYDPSDDCFLIMGNADGVLAACKFSVNQGFKWRRTDYPTDFWGPPGGMQYSRLSGGTFGWVTPSDFAGGQFNMINLANGDVMRHDSYGPYGSEFGSFGYWRGNGQWDDNTKSLIIGGDHVVLRIFFLKDVNKVTVASVVGDILDRSNYFAPGEYDVSGIQDAEITGYMANTQTTARDLLKQLATAFQFDGYESDYILKFRTRGNETATEITQSWMTYNGSKDDGVIVKETLTQESELPMRVVVSYYDQARDYEAGAQYWKRNTNPYPTMHSFRETDIQLPMTMSANQAKQTANKLLMMAWNNRNGYDFKLPWKYLACDPTDVVSVTLDDGTNYLTRIQNFNVGADFTIEVKGFAERSAAYVSHAVADVNPAPSPQLQQNYPESTAVVINTPLLTLDGRSDDKLRRSMCYYGGKSLSRIPFRGTFIYSRVSGGQFQQDQYIAPGMVTGMTLSILPPTNRYGSLDTTTKVDVYLDTNTESLESMTLDDILNDEGANLALIGAELIQFMDAVHNDNGTWTLSGILRARKNTNYALNDHVANEQFVLIDKRYISGFNRDAIYADTTFDIAAVVPGRSINEADFTTVELKPYDLMPPSPEDVQLVDDGTNLTFTVSRRNRYNAPLVDFFGAIPFTEGAIDQAGTTQMTFEVYPVSDFLDIPNLNVAVKYTAKVDLLSISGGSVVENPATASFDRATIEGTSGFGAKPVLLLKVWENGYMDGIPKYVLFKRVSADAPGTPQRWDATELY